MLPLLLKKCHLFKQLIRLEYQNVEIHNYVIYNKLLTISLIKIMFMRLNLVYIYLYTSCNDLSSCCFDGWITNACCLLFNK